MSFAGAHVHGPGRGGGNARRLEAISRVGDDALSAAFRTTRQFDGQKKSSPKITSASRITCDCKVSTEITSIPTRRRTGAKRSRSVDLNTLTLGIYIEVLQRWLGDITGVFARGRIIQPLREAYNVIVPRFAHRAVQF